MKLNMKEKKILYAYACPSHHNTVTRLKWLTALTVDPEAKSQMLHLARKIETETEERWYEAFYHHLRMEMDEYSKSYKVTGSLRCQRCLPPAAQRALKKSVPLLADRRKPTGHLMNLSLKIGFGSACSVVPRIPWTFCRWIEPGTGAFSQS